MVKKIDLHMHTTVSDGTDTPEEILGKVKEKGIELFAITDHDAVEGCRRVREVLGEDDPLFVNGAEFTCKDTEGRYHILGYRYNIDSPAILELVNKAHSQRMKKVHARLEFLKEEFGFEFSKEDLDELLARKNPGKPHIANLMVKYGYVKTKEEGIRDFINKKKIKSLYLDPAEAIEGIIKADGIPILAHPSYGNGEDLIIGDEMEERLKRLMDMGIRGVEAYYSGFTDKLQREILGLAEKYNLLVTAGSDYHGTNKLVILGDNNLDSVQDGPQGLKRFLEEIGL